MSHINLIMKKIIHELINKNAELIINTEWGGHDMGPVSCICKVSLVIT